METMKYDYPITALQFDTRKIVAATGENGIDVSLPSSEREHHSKSVAGFQPYELATY